MMPADRFERQLPDLLAELGEPRTPEYLDDLLWQTAHTSQRPAWTFLERWLPMFDIARQPVAAPRIPWRLIGLALLVIVLLLAALGVLVVGSQPHLPAPFGPAGNGLVAYSAGGDIFTANPATGAARAVVSGPQTDLDPRWSLDGTQIVFLRTTTGPADGQLFVAQADGTRLHSVTPQPLTTILSYAFSPDGKQILISARSNGKPAILIAATDGSGVHRLDVNIPAMNLAWRPPIGAEIMFTNEGDDSSGYGGIYAVSPDSGKIRTILAASADRSIGRPSWSPDGSRIAYGEWTDTVGVHTHVITADGTLDRTIPWPQGVLGQAPGIHAWSNDGTRLITGCGTSGADRLIAQPVDGTATGTDITYTGLGAVFLEWAPDDSSILGVPVDDAGTPLAQVLLDPAAGTSRTLPWTTTSNPAWQRVAP